MMDGQIGDSRLMSPALRNAGSRRSRALLVGMLALTTVASLGLQLVRQAWTEEGRFWNIAWDLFLAWVPFVAAVGIERLNQPAGRRNWPLLGALAVVWLLFFPNAPYLVTEFVHLGSRPGRDAVWWCDLVVILLIAWNGVLLGFASLYLVQRVVAGHLGSAWGWLVAVACMALGSLGITLGRIQRLNSWDALMRPRLIAHSLRQFTDPRTFAHEIGLATLLMGLLTLEYITLAVLVAAARASLASRTEI
jgi:uncharacterized membrane protein